MKQLKQTIWTIAIVLLPFSIFAQIESYPIKDYKLPVIKRTSLDLGFSTNSNGLNGKVKGNPSGKATDNRFNFNGSGDASWNYYFQNHKWQTNSYAYSNISGDIGTSDYKQGSEIKTSSSQLNTSIHAYSSSLYYFRDKLFISLSPGGSINYDRSKLSGTYKDNSGAIISDDDIYSNSTFSNAGMGVGIGYGRIEPVSDVHKIVFTLLDLKKSGRLLKEPSTDEITQISQAFSTLRNERFFDDREQKIRYVKVIDSLITTMGITAKGDIGVSTTLYDNICYAYMPSRYSGYRISLEPRGDYFDHTYTRTGQDRYSSHLVTLGVNANLIYETPINIYWQRNLSMNISYTDRTIDSKNYSPTSKYKVSEINLSGGYGYYPNTRTNLKISFGGRYRNIDSDETYNGMPVGLKYGEFFANGSLYYYLSPKVRIDASAQLAYKTNIDANANIYESNLQFDKNAYDKFTTKEFSYGFSAKLTYAIF